MKLTLLEQRLVALEANRTRLPTVPSDLEPALASLAERERMRPDEVLLAMMTEGLPLRLESAYEYGCFDRALAALDARPFSLHLARLGDHIFQRSMSRKPVAFHDINESTALYSRLLRVPMPLWRAPHRLNEPWLACARHSGEQRLAPVESFALLPETHGRFRLLVALIDRTTHTVCWQPSWDSVDGPYQRVEPDLPWARQLVRVVVHLALLTEVASAPFVFQPIGDRRLQAGARSVRMQFLQSFLPKGIGATIRSWRTRELVRHAAHGIALRPNEVYEGVVVPTVAGEQPWRYVGRADDGFELDQGDQKEHAPASGSAEGVLQRVAS